MSATIAEQPIKPENFQIPGPRSFGRLRRISITDQPAHRRNAAIHETLRAVSFRTQFHEYTFQPHRFHDVSRTPSYLCCFEQTAKRLMVDRISDDTFSRSIPVRLSEKSQ